MIALRTDGGRAVGLGHVRRSLALTAVLQSWAHCYLLLRGDPESASLARRVNVPCLPVGDDWNETLGIVGAQGATVLVVDSYAVSPRELEAARLQVRLLVVVDDAGRFPLPADLVVNSALGVNAPAAEDGMRYLLGPRFALLAPEFAEPAVRPSREEVQRVLLILGGGTPAGLMVALARAARRALPKAALDIVVGPIGDGPAELARALRGLAGFVLHPAPDSIRPLMLGADVAVTAGGVSALELAATGTPAVGICMAPNQEPNLAGLAREGALVAAGGGEDPGIGAAVEAELAALAADSGRRRSLGERARQLVDGRGAERVGAAIRARLATAAVGAEARPC